MPVWLTIRIKPSAAAALFLQKGVDLIFLNISTYALSQNVLPLIQRVMCPVIVLNLQPSKAIDYENFNAIGDRGKMTGEWLSYCQSCVTPELASVFNRAGIKYHLITGYLEEEYVWNEINEWISSLLSHEHNEKLQGWCDGPLLQWNA